MTDRPGTRSWLPIAFALALVAVGAFAPALASGRAANQIPVTDATGTGDALADPGAAAWDGIAPVAVPLASAPSGVPDAPDTSVREVRVRAAHTGDRLYLRLAWADPTADDAITGPRAFLDAAAVQLPANASTRPAIAMGSERSPVSVWYWDAEAGAEELAAGGPGTTTALDGPTVEAAAARSGDGWRLVLARDLAPAGRPAIATDRDLDVALAVWNGSNAERSGRKAVSEWHTLAMGPGPQGPPYEAILWAIAGLAILVVIVVTALAMRRA